MGVGWGDRAPFGGFWAGSRLGFATLGVMVKGDVWRTGGEMFTLCGGGGVPVGGALAWIVERYGLGVRGRAVAGGGFL